jgi:DNA (cytosine-5)-methyltransferase 3A
LQRAGIPVEKYYASEIEPNAIKITQKNFPDTVQLGDVTKIDFNYFKGKIDLIMGGSPCQDLSIAGKRKGLQGERSGLFYKFVEAIKTIKPKYYLLENNVGMPPEAYEEISRLMGCYPIEINSALVSAQNRKRYYWFNFGFMQQDLFNFPTCDIPLPEDKGILLSDILGGGRGNNEIVVENKSATANFIREGTFHATGVWGVINPNNKYMNELAEKNDGEIPVMWDSYNKTKLKNKSPALNTKSNTSYNNAGGTNIMKPIRLSEYEKSAGQAQRVYSVKGKTICINANGGGQGDKTGLYKIDLPDGEYIIRKLSPVECERLQTLPDNYTACVSNTQRYKTIGNGWTVDVIVHILSFLKKKIETKEETMK